MNHATFAQYKDTAHLWITLASGEFYPDYLNDATLLYAPVLVLFKQLLQSSDDSSYLLEQIAQVNETWMRIQLLRVFRKYVSPNIPVEILKRKSKSTEIQAVFGATFRRIHEVQSQFESRPMPDEVLCALLWEYKSRGQKGYDLTERFFNLFQLYFPKLTLVGPQRAGADIKLGDIFNMYPKPNRPVDFIIYDEQKTILSIGFARYDGDRGGAQEDDRIGGYQNCADEFLNYAQQNQLTTKIIFINDGPGLLLGSMWDDYAQLEASWQGKIIVSTIRMFSERITLDWLKS
jgi:hypothetical protein